ncbi:MAG: hypothetical protein Q9177_002543 [Variospora cf. flavescens]
MDHIPLPFNCSFPPIQVPYLDTTPLDTGSWYTYPQRHGWQVEQPREKIHLWRNGEKRPVSETAAFVQSWLYFALLRDVTGDTFSVDYVSREGGGDDGKRVISIAGLEELLGAWTARLAGNADITETKEKLSKLYKLLIEHRSIGLRIHICGIDLGNDTIMLAIAVLSERLMAAVIDLYAYLGLETPVEQTWRVRHEGVDDLGQPILKLMRARGWCPYDVRRLDIDINELSILYYYSNLKAPRSSKDHSKCSGERCLAMLTNPATYRLSHRREGCSCPLLFADQEEVAQILEQGSIPLISMMPGPDHEALKISVKDLAQGHRFVAISHVWAEGSGNVNDNALQTCLLEDISEQVRKLPWDGSSSDYAFWIDTLCVPVRPPNLQVLALNKMRVPYERADHVLVLDSHLRSLDSSKSSPTELFAQVSCSSWMRRLWTLQEGRLARKVWFQFADKAMDVQSIFAVFDRSRVPSKVENWMRLSLYIQLWMQIWYRGDPVKNTSRVSAMIGYTSLALRSRSVSVPSDEALCLFNLMDMDITRVTTVPPAERMMVFWRSFERVPRGFVFSKASSKLSQEGLHWAPSSFMGFQSEKEWSGPQGLNSPGPDDPHAVPTGLGLQVALPGFIFHQGLIERMKGYDFTWNFPLTFQDGDGVWYLMRLEKPWRQGSDLPATPDQLAVVLARELQETGESSVSSRQGAENFSSQRSTVGVLVSVTRTESEMMYVTAHNHVAVYRHAEGVQRYYSLADHCAKEVNIPQTILSNESYVASKQRYKATVERLLEDKGRLESLVAMARYMGKEEGYEHLLGDVMGSTVVVARFGECGTAQKVGDSQQWCVD